MIKENKGLVDRLEVRGGYVERKRERMCPSWLSFSIWIFIPSSSLLPN